MSIYDKAFFTALGLAAVLIVVAVPLALRKVPRNVVYGFRTRATMADDEIWYAANAHFGRGLIVATVLGACAAFAIRLLQPFSADVLLPVSVLVMVAPSLVAAIATQRFVRSLGRSG